MVPNASGRHFVIKAAQRDLVAAAGGIQRAAEICNYGKSTVGRWADIESPEWMPLDAVDRLEAETGLAILTRAWVAARGLQLAEADTARGDACLTGEVTQLTAAFAALLAEWSSVAADGHATPAEADRMRRLVPQLDQAVRGLKEALARVRAEGGLNLVAGGR